MVTQQNKNNKINILQSEHSCWVIFIITGKNLHPDLITRSLDMEPDRSKAPAPDSPGEWQLNSKLRANEEVEIHIGQLLGILLPIRKKLRDMRKEANLEFYCHIEKKTNRSTLIDISPRIMLLIGHLGAKLRLELTINNVPKPNT